MFSVMWPWSDSKRQLHGRIKIYIQNLTGDNCNYINFVKSMSNMDARPLFLDDSLNTKSCPHLHKSFRRLPGCISYTSN